MTQVTNAQMIKFIVDQTKVKADAIEKLQLSDADLSGYFNRLSDNKQKAKLPKFLSGAFGVVAGTGLACMAGAGVALTQGYTDMFPEFWGGGGIGLITSIILGPIFERVANDHLNARTNVAKELRELMTQKIVEAGKIEDDFIASVSHPSVK